MKRLFKLIVWLVGGVVSLLVVAVVVVPLLFDPNDHKQRIAEQIEQHTGLPVRIDGDIKLTVFPWLGVELGRVELGQAPGFAGDAFARTASMQVRVKLLPLLSKQIEMDTVTIAGLELHLARNAEGHGNWEPLLGAAAGGAEPSSGSGAGGPPPVAVLAIGGLDLQNAALTWDDALTGQSYKVSALDLRTGALDLSRPVDLTLEFQVTGGTPALAGTVSLNTAALIDPQAQTLRATGLTLSGDFSQSGPLGGPLTVKLSGDLGADGARQTLSVSGMALDASFDRLDVLGGGGTVAVRGDLSADGATRQLRVNGLALDAKFGHLDALGGGGTLTVRGDLSADGNTQQMRVTGLAMDADLAAVAALGGPAKVSIKGDLGADGNSQTVVLVDMQLDANLAGSALPGGKAQVQASGDLRADLAAQRVGIKGLKSSLAGLGVLGATADLQLSGDFDGDLAMSIFDFAGSRFSGNVNGYPGPDSKIAFDGGAGVRLDAGKKKFSLSDLTLNLPGLSIPGAAGSLRLATSASGDYGSGRYLAKRIDLGGKLSGDTVGGDLDFVLGTGLDADLASGAVKLPGFGIDGNIAGAQIPGGKLPFKVSANVGANLRNQNLDLGAFKASAGPLEASGDLTVSGLLSAPTYKGNLALAKFNPRTLLELLGQPPPDTADPKAVTALEFSAGISGSLADVTLDPLALTLDGTKARGRLQVLDFSKPGYRFQLAVDQLDADRYLPPQKPGSATAATPGAAAGAAAGLPVETLRALDAQGELRIGQLKFSNLKLADIVVTLAAADGLVKISPLGAALYGGRYDGNLGIDARGERAQVSVDERLANVEIGALLRDLKGLNTLSGRTDVQLQATAVGTDVDAIKRTLNGQAAFRLLDGEFRGIDIVGTLCGLASQLGGSNFKEGEGGSTRFSDLTGTATITNGLVANPDLAARSPLLRLSGRGQANLVTEQLDYTATAGLVASCQGQGGLLGNELTGIDVPVRISGTFAKPKYGLDTASLVQELAQSKLRQKLEKGLGLPTQQAPATVPGGTASSTPQQPADPKKQAIEGLLKGLFGN